MDNSKLLKCLEEVNGELNLLANPLGLMQAYPGSWEADYAEAYIYDVIEYLEKLTRDVLEEL